MPPTLTCGFFQMRTLQVIRPSRTPTRRRLVNIMDRTPFEKLDGTRNLRCWRIFYAKLELSHRSNYLLPKAWRILADDVRVGGLSGFGEIARSCRAVTLGNPALSGCHCARPAPRCALAVSRRAVLPRAPGQSPVPLPDRG